MNTQQQGIITLIKSALTGQKLELPQDFSLEAADKLVRSQGLLPLIYQGAYQCGIDGKAEIMQRYQKHYFRLLLHSEQQLRAAERIFRAFDENQIDYLPLKGCILKKLYPHPELRVMGDADILIRKEQYDRVKAVMQQLDFREESVSSYDTHWVSNALFAELHHNLFAEDQEDLCRYFGDCWNIAVKDEGSRYTFTQEDTFVYIFAHMTKHFRFGGIGARQIVDLFVYRQAHPELDEVRLEQTMAQIHLLEFYRNIRRLLAVWFEDAPEDPVTDFITAYIFSGGSWGTAENLLYAQELLRAKQAGKIGHSRFRSILRTIFPKLDHMQLSYNVLYRHPWLCPLFWVVRWFEILLFRRKNIRSKGKLVLGISDEGISEHQKALNYMGLDYRF